MRVILPMGFAGTLCYLLLLPLRPLFTRLKTGWKRTALLGCAALFLLPLPLLALLPLGQGSLAAAPTPVYSVGRALGQAAYTPPAPTAPTALPASRDEPNANVPSASGLARGADESANAAALPGAAGAGAKTQATRPFARINLPQLAAALYGAGAAAALALLVLRYRWLAQRLKRSASPETDPETLALYAGLCRELGVKRAPALLVCGNITAPVLAGVWRSRILLPEEKMCPDALRFALRHELCHHKNGDLLIKCLLLLVGVLHWYSPAAHLLRRAFAEACEQACDEAVTARLAFAECKNYAATLLDFAGPAPCGPVTAFASPAKRLRARLRRLMTPARPRRALRAACFALLCPLLALAVLAGCSLAAGASDGAAASKSLPQAGEVPEVPNVVGMTRSEAESVLEGGSLAAAPDSTGAMEDLRRAQEELLAIIAAQKQGLQEAQQQQMEELQQGAEEQLEELRRQQAEELQLLQAGMDAAMQRLEDLQRYVEALPQDANAVLQLTPFAPLPPDPVEVPDYVGMRVEDIIIMPHFAEIHVRIPGALLLGQNAVRITSQQPAAGTKWDGGPIELKVSGDGPAVTTLALGDVMPDFARFPIGPVFRAEGSGGFGVRFEQPPGPLTTEQSKELWDSGVIIAQKPAAGEVLTKWPIEFSVLVPPAANSAGATEEMHILTYSPEYLEDVGGLLPEGGMLLPVPDAEYSTRGFSTSQRGLDFYAETGTPVIAAAAGTVMKAEMHDSYGFYIVIYHGGGLRTLYAHCDMLLVAAGQNVKAGEQIATVGGTGNVSGSLCHFEVQLDGAVVDPEDYVTLPPEMQLP